jgi:uncharacterized protein YjbI with pentapeptide repeats
MIHAYTKKYIFPFLFLAVVMSCFTDCRRFIIKNIFISKKLEGTNLSGIDFYNLNLENINLTKAKLIRTNFSFCNLKNARFVNADIREAVLSGADMTGADLRGANLRGANLEGVVLKKANLLDAYLYEANLSGADMRGAILVAGTTDKTDYNSIQDKIIRGEISYYIHLKFTDMAGAAISAKWKPFLEKQNIKNFDKIIWSKVD